MGPILKTHTTWQELLTIWKPHKVERWGEKAQGLQVGAGLKIKS